MNKKLKTIIVTVLIIAFSLIIIEYFLLKTYVMPVSSESNKVFMKGSTDDIKEYLEKPGSKVNITSYYSLIRRDGTDILEMLFEKYNLNPDFNFKNEGATPLLFAAKEFKPEAVRILIKYGADVNYKDPYGMTPLIAASYTTFERENKASMKITKMLVEAGAGVNVMSKFGKTTIEGALFSDDIERVKYLVENGGNIIHLNNSGSNYMFYCDYIECYEYFLSKGFSINSINNNGKSILQGSLSVKKNMKLSKQLLSWGADLCHKDHAEDSVLNYVERQKTGPHDKKENPEYYQKRLTENRASEMYKFLEKEYNKKCLTLESN